MKKTQIIWDYQDDYYFTNIDDIEINIRAYSKNSISAWVYDYNIDKEILDNDYKSISELKSILTGILHIDTNLPTVEQLLKIKED